MSDPAAIYAIPVPWWVFAGAAAAFAVGLVLFLVLRNKE